MGKKTELTPSDKRFTWSYDHSHCFDSNSNRHWSLHIRTSWLSEQLNYCFKTERHTTATSRCTRKRTAIRALMRLITRMDNTL